jgi:small conductance mechanosensitive channel
MPVHTLIVDMAVRYGFQVLGALLILGVGALAARWIGRLVDLQLQRQRMEPPMRHLITRALRIVVMLFALIVALDKFGFQVAPLVAGIGVAGIGVGFAMQGVLSNVVAGLTIIFTKPFRVGEHIEVAGVRGDVAQIELFSTTLIHPDRSLVIIPNRKIVGEILHNFGTTRQLSLAVSVPHEVDLAAALATVRRIVAANPRVLAEPAPVVGIAQVTDLAAKIAVMPWVPVVDVVPAEAEIYQSIVEHFRAEKIVTALPQRHEVRLLDGGRAVAT